MYVGTCGRGFGREFSVKSSVFQRNHRLRRIKNCFARQRHLRVRDQNVDPERAAQFCQDFVSFIAPLTLSNFKSECNAIVAFKISKIVVSSIAIIAISISTKITVDSVITDCIEFSQHCLGVHISLSKKTAKKVYNCLLISANVSLQHSDVKYMIESGKGHYSFTDSVREVMVRFFRFRGTVQCPW